MSSGTFDLAPDAKRALREAENLCWRSNVAILSAEHLLAGALSQLLASGIAGLPDAGTVQAAVGATQGAGSSELKSNVMWGSAARAALESTVASARASGIPLLSARRLAFGVVQSGELSPMFFMSLGMTKAALGALLDEGDASGHTP